jgi:hypothetical protein
MSKQPVAGVAFLLNDPVLITTGPSAGQRGCVISLVATSPEPLYQVESESGSDLEILESGLISAQGRSSDGLARIQRWYAARCDGDWEHVRGIKIGTLDNPGWSLKVDLRGTPLEHRPFSEIRDDTDQRNWFVCRVTEERFEAFGGPHMLSKMIDVFLAWAEPRP